MKACHYFVRWHVASLHLWAPPSCLDAQGMAVSASGSGPCASFAQ